MTDGLSPCIPKASGIFRGGVFGVCSRAVLCYTGGMKKLFGTMILVVLLLVGALFGGSAYVKMHTEGAVAGQMTANGYTETLTYDTLTAEGVFDCILVLGCGLSADGGPSPMLKDRLDLALYLYEQGYADKILLTGDNGTVEYNEVQAMREYVEGMGLPQEAIVCDYAGFSTYDSLYRAQKIFGVEKALVVTQGYHLYRALYIGKALGMTTYGAAADQETYSGQRARDYREILARDKDLVKCLLKPEAKIMGEPIEI